MYFLVCKGLSNDYVGVGGSGTVFQKIRPGVGFKTGDFVKEKLEGATVERLEKQDSRPGNCWGKSFGTRV